MGWIRPLRKADTIVEAAHSPISTMSKGQKDGDLANASAVGVKMNKLSEIKPARMKKLRLNCATDRIVSRGMV
ncbi:hypothetical protein SKA58_05965 [Sphingomonas sp. SKA58]|nr:hypothetical protein SKA58_05965 [Sphingomonas sp. SKA58]